MLNCVFYHQFYCVFQIHIWTQTTYYEKHFLSNVVCHLKVNNKMYSLSLLPDPCDQVNCGRGTCKAQNHEGLCSCFQGYTIDSGRCVDIDECLENPCHSTAMYGKDDDLFLILYKYALLFCFIRMLCSHSL